MMSLVNCGRWSVVGEDFRPRAHSTGDLVGHASAQCFFTDHRLPTTVHAPSARARGVVSSRPPTADGSDLQFRLAAIDDRAVNAPAAIRSVFTDHRPPPAVHLPATRAH
jgi:hypothetical protein